MRLCVEQFDLVGGFAEDGRDRTFAEHRIWDVTKNTSNFLTSYFVELADSVSLFLSYLLGVEV